MRIKSSLFLACEQLRFLRGIPGLRLRAGHRKRRDPEASPQRFSVLKDCDLYVASPAAWIE
jgi:hypothetical protein